VDITQGQGPEIARLASNSGLIHKFAKSTVADVIVFNHAPSQPTSNATIREALARAIDPNELMKAYAPGYAEPASSTIAPITECFDPETAKLIPTYDLNKPTRPPPTTSTSSC
jgi:ABC-type transport system substrate-binding protein